MPTSSTTDPACTCSKLAPGYKLQQFTDEFHINFGNTTGQITLLWRHNGRDSVSNHQPRECLLNHLSRCRSKKTSKLRVTGLCAGNSPETGEFPAQRASNAENVSIWWRHQDVINIIITSNLTWHRPLFNHIFVKGNHCTFIKFYPFQPCLFPRIYLIVRQHSVR